MHVRPQSDHRQFLAHVAQVAWRAGGGRSGELPRELIAEIDRQVRIRGLEPALDITRIPRAELRAVVEHASARSAGALARLATELAVGGSVGAAGTELGIALQMLEDLRATADVHAARADLWERRATWAWVWTSEATDPSSWVRGVRWVEQVAARRSDPMPVAAFLRQFANRRGAGEARAREDAAHAALLRAAEAAA